MPFRFAGVLCAALAASLGGGARVRHAAPRAVPSEVHSASPIVQPNPNTTQAGLLRNGVLEVTLEAKRSLCTSTDRIVRP